MARPKSPYAARISEIQDELDCRLTDDERVFDLAPDESTTQALARLGFAHRPNGRSNYSREIYRISDGKSMGHHTAGSANEWIRSGCPEETDQ